MDGGIFVPVFVFTCVAAGTFGVFVLCCIICGHAVLRRISILNKIDKETENRNLKQPNSSDSSTFLSLDRYLWSVGISERRTDPNFAYHNLNNPPPSYDDIIFSTETLENPSLLPHLARPDLTALDVK